MRQNLLLYGLQRSGTNFLENLLTKNFRVKLLNSNRDRKHPIQKHFRLYDDKTIIADPQYNNNLTFNSFKEFLAATSIKSGIDGLIIVTKDPYSWYLSYMNWAIKCGWETPNFHYIEEYNLFYSKWKEFAHETDKILFVKYIDILNQPELVLSKIQDKFGLRNSLRKQFFGTRLQLDKVAQSGSFSDDKNTYYREKLYLQKYGTSELEELNSKIDKELITFLGYEIEEKTNP